MISKFKETFVFSKNNINVFVRIDYVNNKISLVEPESGNSGGTILKKWLFAGKNYVEKTNELMNEIELNKKTIKTLKSKIKDLKKKNK
jgi:hypothetical protein